jgi:hypothetical protein
MRRVWVRIEVCTGCWWGSLRERGHRRRWEDNIKVDLQEVGVLHALWHACTLEPYKTLDHSLVSHTFVLFTACLYYALLCWSWPAGRPRDAEEVLMWTLYASRGVVTTRDTKLGNLPSVCVISIRASESRASGPRQHGWSPTLPLGVVILNKTLVNCYTASIAFPIHVLSHRSANRTCWDPTGGTGWSWLRIGTGGGHLWVRWGTFGFHKCGEFID